VATSTSLQGVIPVLSTPFNHDGDLDILTLKKEVEWVVSQEVGGVATGMVSEILRLNSTERWIQAETICDAAELSKTPVVISCGAESDRETIKLALHAQSCGASAIMVNPPISAVLSDQATVIFYKSIFEVTQVPIVVQDASGYVGRPIGLGVLRILFDLYPERIYFKPEAIPIGPRLSELRDITGGKARIFEGTGGAHLVDSYQRGIIGTMPGADICWAVVALWTALVENDRQKINQLSGAIANLVDLMPTLDTYIAIEKHLLQKQTIFSNTRIRGPVSFRLDIETADECERIFAHLIQLSSKS
jgi:dihydrodipicolinate synthase/N-acetylneuraminate lyase